MAIRILHVSDLHFGRGELRLDEPLANLVRELAPELVVASGDLTHRGRRDQHERAAAFLRSLGPPLFVVPGNHDIPYTFPARFTRPFVEFERHWGSAEPVHQTDELFVIGLNSVRPFRHQSGRIRAAQLKRAAEALRAAQRGALRVVVLHHQLLGAPWRTRKKPVAHRNAVLAGLVDAGAELILCGHIHQAAVSERHEFEASTETKRAVVVAVTPGLGQPRPDRRGEARGFQVYEVTADSIRVATYIGYGHAWALTAERVFPRGREPLAVASAG